MTKLEKKKNLTDLSARSAQGRLARASRRLPYLDGFVPASTGYFCAVWRPHHGQDPVIPMSQHEATQAREENSTKLRKKNLQM